MLRNKNNRDAGNPARAVGLASIGGGNLGGRCRRGGGNGGGKIGEIARAGPLVQERCHHVQAWRPLHLARDPAAPCHCRRNRCHVECGGPENENGEFGPSMNFLYPAAFDAGWTGGEHHRCMLETIRAGDAAALVREVRRDLSEGQVRLRGVLPRAGVASEAEFSRGPATAQGESATPFFTSMQP